MGPGTQSTCVDLWCNGLVKRHPRAQNENCLVVAVEEGTIDWADREEPQLVMSHLEPQQLEEAKGAQVHRSEGGRPDKMVVDRAQQP